MSQSQEFPDAPERSIKYTYDFENDKWDREKVFVQFAQQPFAAGGMRVCYKMMEVEVSSGGQVIAKSEILVAKMFMKKVRPEVYFDEAMTQMLAESYAQEFNKWPLKRKITFLPVNVYQLRERGGQLVNVEPLMQGKYVKHNDNDGNVETDDELPQAFSHFSWEASDHQLLIVDIQGVGDFYTDPQVHSFDGESFGQGNLGMEGVNSFLKSHTCNSLCRALNLPMYVQGRLIEDSSRGKATRINMDAKRSNSPLRWQSGREYEKGLSRAMGSMDEDDGTNAGGARARGGGGGARARLQSDADDTPAPSGAGGSGRLRPQSGLDDPPAAPAARGRLRPESGLDGTSMGGSGRARPQSGLDEAAPAPGRARMRPESGLDDSGGGGRVRGGGRYESDASTPGEGGGSGSWRETGGDYAYDYRSGGSRRDSGGGARHREPSPEGPLVRSGVRPPRGSESPLARVRAVPVGEEDDGSHDPGRNSVSPVARVRVGEGGGSSFTSGGGSFGKSMRTTSVIDPSSRANGARQQDDGASLPAPQKFVTGRRASISGSGDASLGLIRSGSFSSRDGLAGLAISGSPPRGQDLAPAPRSGEGAYGSGGQGASQGGLDGGSARYTGRRRSVVDF